MDALLRRLADDLSSGALSPSEAADALRRAATEDLGFARLDHQRVWRQGLPEVVLGQGKTPAQISAIVASLADRDHPVIVTRLDPDKMAECGPALAGGHYDPTARVWVHSPTPPDPAARGPVVVACAGTADLPAAAEAAVVAGALGNEVRTLTDVGVAGLHRLLGELDTLRAASVVIAVAGMEGALPSVIGGLVAAPVIAVPTSVGYGTGLDGVAALTAMLNSCAAGVTVVNIDNGFGAAWAATLINRPNLVHPPGESPS